MKRVMLLHIHNKGDLRERKIDMTVHNEAKKGEIAKSVIMPGDPMRAKYIAEHYLENPKLVNTVRGMYAYTGTYHGKELTVMGSGMGMPSMGIYSYELFQFYDVEEIIRIGTCGAYDADLKLFDIVLSEQTYTESNFALTYNNSECHYVNSDDCLNKKIIDIANTMNIPIFKGNTICVDFVDFYMEDPETYFKRVPETLKPLSGEMEAFALFYVAASLHKKASCLMTVVDSPYIAQKVSPEEREQALDRMITLALSSLT